MLGVRGLGVGGVVLVRPPGSVPEREFLKLCVRCGVCFKACPFNVLQPVAFQQGLDGLWTPYVVADWSGCDPTCNNCGQVCPTGAIRAVPLEEKRAARMGLGVVNEKTCLPFAGSGACELCADECTAAGYHAIEFVRVGVEVDAEGTPIADTGYRAPVVLPEECNGCGLCQARCYAINVKQKRLLETSAIQVVAGPGMEDRMMTGSYQALRAEELRKREQAPRSQGDEKGSGEGYLPDFLK
jgi:ferredoxin